MTSKWFQLLNDLTLTTKGWTPNFVPLDNAFAGNCNPCSLINWYGNMGVIQRMSMNFQFPHYHMDGRFPGDAQLAVGKNN